MSEVIEVDNITNSTQVYSDLVRHDSPAGGKGTRIDSFTILPIQNPDKSVYKAVLNGTTLFEDFKIGVEVEYPFPLPYHDPWKIDPGSSLVVQIRADEAAVTVSAIGKIIGRKV